jgi:hypothetical protein
MTNDDTPVGAIEIAERLGVKLMTVHTWLHRKRLPPPDYDSVNGSRAWRWGTIREWAWDTGRLERGTQLSGIDWQCGDPFGTCVYGCPHGKPTEEQ